MPSRNLNAGCRAGGDAMNEPSEKLLNDYLAGSSELSRAYRASAAEAPPTHLDAAIQAAAHRAVGARPTLARGSRLRAWYVPLSAAAVVVLASLLVLRISQSPEGKPDADVVARAPLRPPSVATAPVAEPAAQPQQAAPSATERTEASVASAESTMAASSAEATPRGPVLEETKKMASAQLKDERNAALAKERQAAGNAQSRVRAAASPAPSTGPADADASGQGDGAQPALLEPPAAAPAQAPEAAPGAAAAGAAAPLAAPRGNAQADAPAPRDDKATPGAPMQEGATRAAQPAQERASSAAAAEEKRKVLADKAAEESVAASNAQPPAAPAKLARRAEDVLKQEQAEGDDVALQSNPEQWLAKIVELQRDGKTKQMQQALRAFKLRYPQHALTPELSKAWDALKEVEAGAESERQ